MNNDYDRGPSVVDVTPIQEDLKPAVKLILLNTGQQLLAEFTELEGTDKYRISNVREIQLEEVKPGSKDLTVSYGEWMPLSKSNTFDIPRSIVVVVTEPHDVVSDNYLGAIDG